MAFVLANGARGPSNVATLMAYVQYLADKGLMFRTINNYLSALKTNLDRLGFDVGNFFLYLFLFFFKFLQTKDCTLQVCKT